MLLSSGVTLSTTSAVATPNIPFGTFNGIFADAKAKINGKFNIVISPMNVQIGTTPSYDVYISFDKVNWEKVTKEPLDGSESVRCPVQFSSDGRPMYVKVEAKNDIGTVTSNIVTITLDTVNATEFMEEIMNNIINKFNDIL